MSENENKSATGIDEDTIRFFVWSVWNFFQSSTGIEPEVGTPYLFDSFDHDDYTGIIGVSGNQRGAVYFTMCRELLDSIISKNFPELEKEECSEEQYEEMRNDYAGEMTNIVSGNVRNYLGEQFLISVPVVVTAKDTAMRMTQSTHGIIFPVTWNGFRCHLILSLENNAQTNEHDILERVL
ncbi:chemotaxis protein CheX [Rubritalea marina]|uniref:chemotaxis protein CheX n=1 Tax=Rubritalea marina TaxID=361055 RepID=UPI0003674251|nr:chemotaxis protein CheX [Rubritalea marina]